MPAIPQISKPKKGDDVRDLWVHVCKLVDLVNQQSVLIAELAQRFPRRKTLEPDIIWNLCET
jgi:hypothetical protein